jgi:hypothetical protein
LLLLVSVGQRNKSEWRHVAIECQMR